MEYLSGEAIAGFFFVIIVAVIALQRIGIITIPTTRKNKQDNPGNSGITSLERRVDRMANNVRYIDTCDARHEGVEKQLNTQTRLLEDILRKLP